MVLIFKCPPTHRIGCQTQVWSTQREAGSPSYTLVSLYFASLGMWAFLPLYQLVPLHIHGFCLLFPLAGMGDFDIQTVVNLNSN